MRVRSSEDECTDVHNDIKNAEWEFGHVSAYSTTGASTKGGVGAGAMPEFTHLVIIPRAGGGHESCRFVTTEEGRLRILLMHTQYDLHAGAIDSAIDSSAPRCTDRARRATRPQCTAIIFYGITAMDNLLDRIANSADPFARICEMFRAAQKRATDPEIGQRCSALRDALRRYFPSLTAQ